GVLQALNKKVKIEKVEAIGVIETKDAVSSVYAADAALKAAYVEIVEIKTGSGIGGKGYFTINGEVGAVKTAISAGVKAVGENAIVNRIVIPNAHPDMLNIL
ncbi:MAG: BMC domain-containing protein, partial [Elusimicrobiales bacterium]|nr:BMC domain-containing protein [Elusimicrobiales bacterium]